MYLLPLGKTRFGNINTRSFFLLNRTRELLIAKKYQLLNVHGADENFSIMQFMPVLFHFKNYAFISCFFNIFHLIISPSLTGIIFYLANMFV